MNDRGVSQRRNRYRTNPTAACLLQLGILHSDQTDNAHARQEGKKKRKEEGEEKEEGKEGEREKEKKRRKEGGEKK